MYSLRFFGGVALEGPSGPLSGPVLQKRPLALLAMLAASRGGGWSRDKLMTYLWAEHDEARARHLLANSVYVVRKALGDEAVQALGEYLRLNAVIVGTDIADFAAALEEGDFERAVALYAGPFMDGFQLSGAAEFDQWVESERRRLAGQYETALESLAEQAGGAGYRAGAGECWNMAAANDPYNSRLVLRLMSALTRAGDPANAIQLAREHERFLQKELGVEPPVDLQAFVEELMQEPLPPTAGSGAFLAQAQEAAPQDRFATAEELGEALRSPDVGWIMAAKWVAVMRRNVIAASAAGFVLVVLAVGAVLQYVGGIGFLFRPGEPGLDPNKIIVAPFENLTGDESMDHIGRMAADWITQGVARTGLVEVVPSSAALYASKHGSEQAGVMPGLDRARGTAEATGSGTVVWGSYYRDGDDLLFQVQVTDASRNRFLSIPDPVSGSVESPLPAIVELQQRVMGALAASLNPLLGESPAELIQPPQYDAYLEYVKGLEASVDLELEEALYHFRRAAILDTTFATAQLYTCFLYWWTGQDAKTDSTFRLVERSRDRLTPADREFLDVVSSYISGDKRLRYEAARRRVEIAAEPFWLWMLAIASRNLNRPREAAEALERLDPQLLAGKRTSDWYWHYLTLDYHMLEDYERELAVARRGRQLNPESGWILADEIRALVALGRVEEVRRVVDGSFALPFDTIYDSLPALLYAALELHAHGHPEAAQEVAERAIAWWRARPSGDVSEKKIKQRLAYWLFVAGHYQEARVHFEELARDSLAGPIATHPQMPRGYLGYLGVMAARAGDRAEALRIDERLRRQESSVNLRWRASIAAHLGERDRALDLARASRARGGWTYQLHIWVGLGPLRDDLDFQRLLKPDG